jgi:osmotically-inducible protein OsmY
MEKIMKRILGIGSFIILVALLVCTGCMTRKNTSIAMTANSIESGPSGSIGEAGGDARTEDAMITSAIKLKFASDDLVTSSNINIDTIRGKVTLSGKAHNQNEADRAMQLARSTDGVKVVRSNLVVKSGGVR